MKSLPEKDFWKEIKNRLEQYKEEPQDDWLKIASVIPPPETPDKRFSLSMAGDVLSVASMTLLLWTLLATSPTTHSGSPDALPVKSALPDKTIHAPGDPLRPDTTVQARLQQDRVAQAHQDQAPEQAHAGVTVKNDRSGTQVRSTSGDEQPGRQTSPVTLPGQAMVLATAENAAITGEPVLAPVSPEHSGNAAVTMLPSPDSVRVVERDTVFFAVAPVLQQKQKPKRKFKPSVYAMVTPSLAYQKVIPLRHDDINIQKLNGDGIVSADRFGLGMEVGFQMQVSRHFELYASLSYYQQHQSVSYSYAAATGIIVGGTDKPWSYQVSPGETTRRFSYNMRNAGAGAGVLYHIRGRKLMHKIGGGLQYQQGLLSSQGEYSYNNAASRYLSYQMMYRMEYSLSGRASIFFQPQFIHAIIANEELREPFDIKPYRAGIGIGLVYHLY